MRRLKRVPALGDALERTGDLVKVFGGSGRRQAGSGQTSGTQRNPNLRNDLNGASRGYNNRESAERPGRAPAPQKKRGRGWLIALCTIALIVTGVFFYWKITTKPPESSVDDVPGEGDSANVERYYTLLVVGDDQEGGNTDTIMVMRFDTQEMTVNVVSIPRDTTVNTELENKKINAVYHNMGGMDALLDQVERITGFRPNNYMMVDIDVFMEVVDALGGVEFDVPQDMYHEDFSWPDGKGGYKYVFVIDVKKGLQTLNGHDALGVFRFRGYPMGDIDRVAVQHDLMMAIAAKAMSTKNVVTLYNIASSVLDKCDTDLTVGNVQWYIQEFMKMSLDNISFYTAPTDNCMVFDTAYVSLQADAWMEMVNSKLMPYDKTVTKEELPLFVFKDGYIDSRGYRIVQQEDFYCTNGEKANNTNFYKNTN